jgi:hypothetical protein
MSHKYTHLITVLPDARSEVSALEVDITGFQDA